MEICIKWNLCRICLKSEKNDLTSLFNDAKLAEQIKECTGKTISESDGLPNQICFDCINGLNETYKFLVKFRKSNEQLTSIVHRTMSTTSLIQNESKEQKAEENNSVLNCKSKNNKRVAKDSTSTPYKILFSSDEEMRENKKRKIHDIKDNPSNREESPVNDHNDNKKQEEEEEFIDINNEVGSEEGFVQEDDTGGNYNDYIIVLNDNETKIKLSQLTNDDISHSSEENEEKEQLFHYKDEEYENSSNQGEVYVLSDINSMIEEDDDNENTALDDAHPIELTDSQNVDQDMIETSGKCLSKKSTAKPHICLICNNTFTRISSLKTHLRRHKNIKKYNCELCSKTFGTSHNLANHMRVHTGEKPFQCEYCDRRFADRSTHLKHTRIHTNERPFSCDKCGKSFTLSTTLKAHEIIHTGIKQHVCSICNKAFKLPHQLKAHMNTKLHNSVDEEMLYDIN